MSNRIQMAEGPEFSPEDRNLYLTAISAHELRNFDYAISLLRPLIDRHPDFIAARELLRKCENPKGDS